MTGWSQYQWLVSMRDNKRERERERELSRFWGCLTLQWRSALNLQRHNNFKRKPRIEELRAKRLRWHCRFVWPIARWACWPSPKPTSSYQQLNKFWLNSSFRCYSLYSPVWMVQFLNGSTFIDHYEDTPIIWHMAEESKTWKGIGLGLNLRVDFCSHRRGW